MAGRRRSAIAVATVLAAAGLFTLTGCGSDSSGESGESGESGGSGESSGEGFEQAADTEVCTSQAKPLDPPYGEGFPADWTFPPKTVVYHYEDRGDAGVIVTAVSAAKFADILDYMNTEVVDAGFEIESGETEEHDAEAEWKSDDFAGRWAIRESATCPGETVIQVLALESAG